jgi:aspartate/methionine/tyrosine aminotransferase
VPLRFPDFQPDLALARAVTDRTRIILVNDPHNPTGAVFTAQVRAEIVRLAERHDAIIVTDEVYEHLVFEGTHVPIATLPEPPSAPCRSHPRARPSPRRDGRSAGSPGRPISSTPCWR